GTSRGAVWVLFLNIDGTVKSHQKISDTQGGFTGILDDGDLFGTSVASLGDLDGDGVGDLAVGATGDDDGDTSYGAVWVLFLNSDGTVKAHQKISATQGGFTGILDVGDGFGRSVASLGDLDGAGAGDLAVGALFDDDGGPGRGAVWVLFLDGVPACPWDLSGDGDVGPFDLALLLGVWGPCLEPCEPGDPAATCAEDLDGNCNVGPFDLALLLGNWGPCL
ncbi:MAG: FG-GAP repeat protein, partial [Planctomycetes bacterium]|nr:FG-GAP repeat protein [Planctomycetota bacterium]